MIYALTIFAKPGAGDMIARLAKEGAAAARRAPGCLMPEPHTHDWYREAE